MRIREAIVHLDSYVAGRSEASVEHELGLTDVVKLGSNESPYGPFPSALEAIVQQAKRLHRYPELDFELAEMLAAKWDVSIDQVQLGNGADPIIGWLSTAYLDPGDEVVMATPSFVSYRLDAIKMGARPIMVPLRDGAHDLPEMLARITPSTRIVYVCNPNNPTGTIVDRDSLTAFIEQVPDDVLVVVDEAYAEYVDDPSYPEAITEYFANHPNVAVLRTFSKLYGLAGVRVGYMIAHESVVRAVGKIRHYFDVSDLGHVAAMASLVDIAEIERRKKLNKEAKTLLENLYDSLGLKRLPSHTNFVAIEVDDAKAIADTLLNRGVITRPLSGFGGMDLLRVTIGSPREMERFTETFTEVIASAQLRR